MKPEFFLSAPGIICPLGDNCDDVLRNLLSSSTSGMVPRNDFIADKTFELGSVPAQLPPIPDELAIYNTRCNRLLLAAYKQIENEVMAAIEQYGRKRVAVIIGSGTSGIDEVQQGVDKSLRENNTPLPFDYNALEISSPSLFLARYIGLEGANYTVSTACTSSAKAFASAQNLLNMGLCDAVIVGGSDNLCQLTVRGFHALESLATKICNPFSKNRNGISLGEGAAVFLMTRKPGPIALLGVGESSDAYHKTSPDPQGTGALTAMLSALKQAGIKPEAVDYINLHGTGTVQNDAMESLAVNSLYNNFPYCSSTKPLTGHTLGSAGVIELALCWLALSEANSARLLPPHVWDGQADASLAPLNFVAQNKQFAVNRLNICMSNSFAFGGSNASLIIGRV